MADDFSQLTPAQQYEYARQHLVNSGAPLTAENFNRIMLHLYRGAEGGPVELSSEPERGGRRRASAANAARNVEQYVAPVRLGAQDAAAAAMPDVPALRDATMGRSLPPAVGGGAASGADASMPGDNQVQTPFGRQVANRGAIGRRSAEGVYGQAPPRQADETGVDQAGLAAAMLAPFAMMALPSAPAVANLGVTVAPQAARQITGNAPARIAGDRVIRTAEGAIPQAGPPRVPQLAGPPNQFGSTGSAATNAAQWDARMAAARQAALRARAAPSTSAVNPRAAPPPIDEARINAALRAQNVLNRQGGVSRVEGGTPGANTAAMQARAALQRVLRDRLNRPPTP